MERMLGLGPVPDPPDFWMGPTDYGYFLRPRGTIRAVMLFARFPDTTADEDTRDLYARLVPDAAAHFARSSYGRMRLTVDAHHRWLPMERPSTWEGYDTRRFATHGAYIAEAVRRAEREIDFARFDIVYVVGSRAPGMPNSPTWSPRRGDGVVSRGKEIRHAATFGNDIRNDNWGWRVLCHETGHMFGLPDLYSYAYRSGRPYREHHQYVGPWDLMGYVAPGREFLAWSKRKLGWLEDRDFVVAPPGSGRTEATIAPIHRRGGKKAVVLPVSATEAFVAEVRGRGEGGAAGDRPGVLLYRVSLSTRGEGWVRVLPAAPDDGDPAKERRDVTLYDALFFDGPVLDDPAARARIEIIGRSGDGYRLRVTR